MVIGRVGLSKSAKMRFDRFVEAAEAGVTQRRGIRLGEAASPPLAPA
jgi:hypothetical protein